MTTYHRTIVTIPLAAVAVICVTCYRVYQAEIAEGKRRVDAFWGRLSDGYQPITVVDPFPPILNPNVVAEADIAGDELVLAVTVNGAARAYPLNMLTGPEREIINDELGGQAIAATW